jgi:hypothetical protein
MDPSHTDPNTNAWIVGPYCFTRKFNPRCLLDFYPFEVQEYFNDASKPGRRSEFIAWRDYFFPGENRCDNCFYFDLPLCDSFANNPCSSCQNLLTIDGECRRTTQDSPPINLDSYPIQDSVFPGSASVGGSNLLASAVGPTAIEGTEQDVAQDKGKGKTVEVLVCNYCTSLALNNCDMTLGFDYGCTTCRRVGYGL